MIGLFSESARHVIVSALTISKHLRHDFVAPEHMLLGLVRESERNPDAPILWFWDRELKYEAVKSEIKQRLDGFQPTLMLGETVFTSRAKLVLELAMEARRDRGGDRVRASDLLHGLMEEERDSGASLLDDGEIAIEPGEGKSHMALDLANPSGASSFETLLQEWGRGHAQWRDVAWLEFPWDRRDERRTIERLNHLLIKRAMRHGAPGLSHLQG